MENNDNLARKLAMLSGAERLHRLLDPEQLTAACHLDRLEVDTATMSWKARLSRKECGSLNLSGVFIDDGMPVISGAFRKDDGGTVTTIPLMPAKKLVLAIMKGGKAPGPARPFITKERAADAENGQAAGKPFIREYLALARSALTWNVETCSKEEEKELTKYSFRYDYDEYSSVVKVYLTLSAALIEGKISVETDIDAVGLGNRKVTLRKNLGMLHSITADCRSVMAGRNVASLRVAFDLYDRLPILYQTEIIENVTPTLKKRGPKPSRK